MIDMQSKFNIETAGDEDRWEAVMARDAGADGAFVYAVRSTGIFCKPSCPSKRPRREQVAFFAGPVEAREAGFRACLRCKPEGAVYDPQADSVSRACRYIEHALDNDEPVSLTSLGGEVGLSPFHLQRIFKRATGVSPRQYAQARRLERLRDGLRGEQNVTEALYDAGYGSSSRVYEQAPTTLGMTPGEYRRGGKEMRIAYTAVPCALGYLLVAATGRGICAVRLGDSERELEQTLQNEFHAASIRRDDEGMSEWVRAILRYLDGERHSLDLPLDVQATAFQMRVWEELRRIPYGSTRSYGEIAARIGEPKAARAVAQACGGNPVALVVPCHRVVREDGGLGGYRWGVERKRTLLDRERAASVGMAEAGGGERG